MELDPVEQKRGRNWLIGAGIIAVLFSYFLYDTDLELTHSPREDVLRSTLFELRMAQTTLDSGVSDERQIGPLAEEEPIDSHQIEDLLHHDEEPH